MTDPNNLDHQPIVEDLVDDPIVTNLYAIRPAFTGELGRSWRSGRRGEQVDGGTDPLLFLARKGRKESDRPTSQLDAECAHVRPRSALTSSQGT